MTHVRSILALALLSGACLSTASADIIVGAGAGGASLVARYSSAGNLINSFDPFPGFTGGVRVAAGDVNGDGYPDIITGAGPGGGPHVRVFSQSGATMGSFPAYDPTFTGGIFVGAGHVTPGGGGNIITGADAGGGPHVKVFSSASGGQAQSFFPFTPSFTGGVRVAAGDLNNDGIADIIAGAGPGGGPHVQVFSGANGSLLHSFLAFDPSFSGGVYVASGDIDGDGLAEMVISADSGGAPTVSIFSGATGSLLNSFLAYPAGFQGGVRVAVGDVNGDGLAEIITGAGPGAGPHVKVFSGLSGIETASFFAGSPSFTGGIYVAAIPAPGTAAFVAAAALVAVRRRRR